MTSKQIKAPKQLDTTETPSPPGFEAFAGLNAEAFHAFDEVAQSMVEGIEAYHEEALRFVGQRLRQDIAMPRALLACWSPQEALGVYLEFLQTAQKDYIEEAERLAKIGTSLAGATFERVEMETVGAPASPRDQPQS